MATLLGDLRRAPVVFKAGAALLALEAAYILYWLGAMIYHVIGNNAGEEHRTFHAFLALHMVTIPIAILYVIETRNKRLYFFIIWVFVASVVFDVFKLLSAILYLERIDHPTAYALNLAGSVWVFSMATLELLWFLWVLAHKAGRASTDRFAVGGGGGGKKNSPASTLDAPLLVQPASRYGFRLRVL